MTRLENGLPMESESGTTTAWSWGFPMAHASPLAPGLYLMGYRFDSTWTTLMMAGALQFGMGVVGAPMGIRPTTAMRLSHDF